MMAMRFSGMVLASALLASGIATTAAIAQQKQNAVSALKGHNSNAPIDLSADRLEVQDRADRAIFAGNVQLNRDQNQVIGSRLVIDLDSGRAVIDGGPPGVNQSGGRVTGHFMVPQKKQQQ
jgi:lipopolysaccharide export system protein LptA